MNRHLLRWVQFLHGAISILIYAVQNDKGTRSYIDVAEQLESIAKNIRERAGGDQKDVG